MLQLQALKPQYHLIAIRLHEDCKFDAVPQLTRGQKPSGSLHKLSRIFVNMD